MDEDDLTAAERAALLVLLIEGAAVENGHLANRHGFRMVKPLSTRLVDQGYVKSERPPGRGYVVELTGAGRERCERDLTTDFPVDSRPSKVVAAALRALLRTCEAVAERQGSSLVALLAPPELETRIREVYWRLARMPDESVPLSRLRQALDGVRRHDLDEALKRMYRARQINLAPHADQKSLSHAERDAAIQIGGQDKHVLLIGRR